MKKQITLGKGDMEGTKYTATITKGSRVKAFHPRTMGVVYEGTIKSIAATYVSVSFDRNNPRDSWAVPFSHIVEVLD